MDIKQEKRSGIGKMGEFNIRNSPSGPSHFFLKPSKALPLCVECQLPCEEQGRTTVCGQVFHKACYIGKKENKDG